MSDKAGAKRAGAGVRAAAAAAVVLGAALAAAQQPPAAAAQPRNAWWKQPGVVAELALSEAQTAAVEAMELSQRERRAAATRTYSQAYASLVVALTAETVDEAAVGRARAAVAASWEEIGAANLARLEALRGILTAAQVKRLPAVAPQALRAGPAVLRALGETGPASLEGRSRDLPSAPE